MSLINQNGNQMEGASVNDFDTMDFLSLGYTRKMVCVLYSVLKEYLECNCEVKVGKYRERDQAGAEIDAKCILGSSLQQSCRSRKLHERYVNSNTPQQEVI